MVDDAIHCVRSVAFRFRGKGSYSLGAIREEISKYQRVDGETYWDFAKRFLSDEEIKTAWDERVRERS
jgi:hypothetical protein